MDRKQKVLIFPFSRDAISLVLFLKENNTRYEISHLVAPNCIGETGKDAGEYYNLPTIGIPVESDFEECIADSDIVFFVWSKMNSQIDQKCRECILYALKCQKTVECFDSLDEVFLGTLKEYCESGRLICHSQYTEANVEVKQFQKLYSINTPTVFIGETVNGLEGYDVMLCLTEQFKKEGYKVSAIGDKCYSEFMGLRKMPRFIYKSPTCLDNLVYDFNKLVKDMEIQEQPDIIFIQLPGAIMKFNNEMPNGFGIMPYLLSQAVNADAIILCMPFDEVDIKYFDMLNDVCMHHLGIELCGVDMSNSLLDVPSSKQAMKPSYLQLSQERLDDNLKQNYEKSHRPIFNCFNRADCKRMSKRLRDIIRCSR